MFTIRLLKAQPLQEPKRNPYVVTVLGRGVQKGNPKYCLHCRKPIRRGDAWEKQTAPDGSYSVIRHAGCK